MVKGVLLVYFLRFVLGLIFLVFYDVFFFVCINIIVFGRLKSRLYIKFLCSCIFRFVGMGNSIVVVI